MNQNSTHTGEDTDYSRLSPLRHHENRRRYPRVDLRLPAIVTTQDHRALHVRVRDLSAEGVQIRCDPETARAIHPRQTPIQPGEGPDVMLRVELPVDGQPRMLAAEARICYMAVRSPDQIAFGLNFTDVRLEAKKVLAAFIMESLRPRD